MLNDVLPPLEENVFVDEDEWCFQQDSAPTGKVKKNAKIFHWSDWLALLHPRPQSIGIVVGAGGTCLHLEAPKSRLTEGCNCEGGRKISFAGIRELIDGWSKGGYTVCVMRAIRK